jgi:hypothetical protein
VSIVHKEGIAVGNTVTEYNVFLPAANTEYTQTLPAHCRAVSFRCRTSAAIRYAWATGRVAAPTAPYQTLPADAEYSIQDIHLVGADRVLYFASAAGGVVVEIEAWV